MRALVVDRLAPGYAGCALREVATPVPGPDEVLIEVCAASVNFPDLLMTRGEYQHKPPLPFTPGMEVAGLVAAVGSAVENLRLGDEVVGGSRTGGFAEFAAASAAQLRRKPGRLTFAQAAACGAAAFACRGSSAARTSPRRGRRSARS